MEVVVHRLLGCAPEPKDVAAFAVDYYVHELRLLLTPSLWDSNLNDPAARRKSCRDLVCSIVT
jgi:hypothetical protein